MNANLRLKLEISSRGACLHSWCVLEYVYDVCFLELYLVCLFDDDSRLV